VSIRGSISVYRLIIVGIDLIAVRHHSSSPNVILCIAGTAIGMGIGYFLKLFRSALTKNDSAPLLTKPNQKEQAKPATTIAQKITQLGGHLSEPASAENIEITEKRLDISLPIELREFLLQHNGTTEMSDIGMWSFWSCSEITNYSQNTGKKYFTAVSNIPAELRGDRLILFADAMIHAPVYGVYLAPGEPYHGSVFELTGQTVSANTFSEWIDLFLARAEDAVLKI
jgi:hypothetical protein